MKFSIYPNAASANAAAAELLAGWLSVATTRNVMVAGGNSPLDLYRRIAERRLSLSHLNIFMLDEYVGVPLEEPRNCANLLRYEVAEAWGTPVGQFFRISSLPDKALASVREHERLILQAGGLDIAILGLGRNGHIGFNEPGSPRNCEGRLVPLEPISVEANRQWFGGDYAPTIGVTTGLRTILAARRILALAYGKHKAFAVRAMVKGPQTVQCPGSLLQDHPNTWLFLDAQASADLKDGG